MTGARFLPASGYNALKAATRQLVDLAGGGPQASRITRLGQPDLSRGGSLSLDNAERFLPIDVVADLEASAGDPLITRTLADLADCLLIPLPKGMAGDELSREAGMSAQHFGKMMADFGAAICDGSIEAREAAGIRADIRQLMVSLAAFDQTIREKAEATDG